MQERVKDAERAAVMGDPGSATDAAVRSNAMMTCAASPAASAHAPAKSH